MCGRFALPIPRKQLEELFAADVPEIEQRSNVAPSQPVLVIRLEQGRRVGRMVRWGLVPYWSKDPKIGYKLINARAETAPDKPSFRDPFRLRRCLVPARGFYEWDKSTKPRTPHLFGMADGGIMAFAGLWDRWRAPGGETLETCTILTCPANELVARYHDRMPVVLPPQDWDAWLNPATPRAELLPLLRTFPAEAMEDCPADPRLNAPDFEPLGIA